MRPRIIAHRGSSRAFPEHTRAAYVQALLDGADGVECDVHLSADGHLVLHHDAQLGRTSTGRGPVGAHTLAQLRRLDFVSWKGVEIPTTHGGPDEQLLTLPELLELLRGCGRRIGLAIETKHPSRQGHRLEEAVLTVLMRAGWDPESGRLGNLQISIMSFHPDAVRYVLQTVAARHVCQLIEDATPESVGAALMVPRTTARLLHASMRWVVPPAEPVISRGLCELAGPGIRFVRDHPGLVRTWLAQGSILRVWTVDSRADLELCLALGVQQITTNRPAQLPEWMGAPGATRAVAASGPALG
ncbi:glycerophosphodiester phosphodiesterase family protein [Kocuria palustris]|uniref:glycerophosphodiester phosphodiesterase n=1 Tax=Kocuria palustris TaxID=71999 RepID=UPI0011A0EC26|nr:glycerophosphodiester phosphodiesterase family protein [Kocuria palustris]